MTYLLLPGRQIVHTRFQEEYLNRTLGLDLAGLPEMIGQAPAGRASDLVFAVTSCNKSNSRYNPLPFETRAILVYEFARRLREDFGVGFHIVGIPHYPPSDHFARHVLKEIAEQTEGRLNLTPEGTVVFTSTPDVIGAYRSLGFPVLPRRVRRRGAKADRPRPGRGRAAGGGGDAAPGTDPPEQQRPGRSSAPSPTPLPRYAGCITTPS